MEEDFAINQQEAEVRELMPILYDIETLLNQEDYWHQQPIDVSTEDNYLSTTTSIINQPFGLVLILGSKHSELDTILKPLAGSIAAGNCSVLVPNIGEQSSQTDKVLATILKESLDPSRVLILDQLDISIETLILQNQFDLVFTNQDPSQNQPLHQFCSEHAIPLKKHTNGMNIALIEELADVKSAAKDLALNKFYKSGQHTANLDVIYVHE